MTMESPVLILCGGKGTRLGSILGDLPKPMVSIGGKPVLEHQISILSEYGFSKFVLLGNFRHQLIQKYFGDGSRLGVSIQYSIEETPLGTAGAVASMKVKPNLDFILVYGDLMFNFDFKRLLQYHKFKGGVATLVVHPNSHPYDSDLVELDEDQRVVSFKLKPHPPDLVYSNLVNAGVYVLSPEVFSFMKSGVYSDFAQDFFPYLLSKGVNIYGFRSPEYIKDMGTPDRYLQVKSDYERGLLNINPNSQQRPAVFLDRDGVLNYNYSSAIDSNSFSLLPGVTKAVKKLNNKGILTVVVTNQPGVAKGHISLEEIKHVHQKLEHLLALEGAWADLILFCPHHPQGGYQGERAELKVPCMCRKPEPGMLLQASRQLNIDLGRSFMIGDSPSDVTAANKAGVSPVLVASNQISFNMSPDSVPHFWTLEQAVDYVLAQQYLLEAPTL
jgi:mannose-1-phosphate guanylyltransferase/phosphomannomutase